MRIMQQIRKFVAALVAACLLAVGSTPTAAADGVSGLWDAPSVVQAYSGGYGGFYSSPFVPAGTCLYGTFFIDTTTPAGSAIFSLLVTAHATQEKIVVIYYTVAGNGWCWVDRLDIHKP